VQNVKNIENNNILEFVERNLENLDEVIAYCAGVSKSTASVDRF
jgi:hypothetical protein